MQGALIEVVEDDAAIGDLIRFNLEKEGFRVQLASRADEALSDIFTHMPALVILDWMLPDQTGISVLREMREDKRTRHVPVIMLTARAEEDDIIKGLELGASDYVTKPFSVRALMSRVKARLREGKMDLYSRIKTFEDIEIDFEAVKTMRGRRRVNLGHKEFEVLRLLTNKPGRVLSREKILDHVWGIESDIEIRTVDVTVGRLRRALCYGKESDPIRTVRGIGYAWDMREERD